jgi:hypothetical protein
VALVAVASRPSPAATAHDVWIDRMDYLSDVLTALASLEGYGYHATGPLATEPTALSALALLAHGRDADARPPLDWLVALQGADGSLGIEANQPAPGWATPWSVMAWLAARNSSLTAATYQKPIERATGWLLQTKGSRIEWLDHSGHDTTIIGWPWVEGTHSWIEPTAMSLLALRHAGLADHPRAREAARLLVDRLLRSGGCNYGNTVVFGQELRSHVEPTGLSLVALRGQADSDGRIGKSIDYLQGALSQDTTTISLSYGLLGLAAHDAWPQDGHDWLRAAARRTLARDRGGYKLALLALAWLGTDCPLIPADATTAGATAGLSSSALRADSRPYAAIGSNLEHSAAQR